MKETITQQPQQAATYIPFVRKIATRIAKRLPPSVEVDDLVSAGTIGLMEAIDRYKPEGGRSFETYAEFRVKGAIIDELRRNDPLKRAARQVQDQIERQTNDLTSELGRRPEIEEMARALKTTVAHYEDKMRPFAGWKFVPVDADAVAVESEDNNQEEQLGRKEMVALVRASLGRLSQRQQLVLSLYYVEEMSQAQIGETLGVSESRVCQILSEAMKQLRKHVRPEKE